MDDDRVPTPRPEEPGPRLSFPDLPRLELDELLGQLVDRAQEVMATQGRLRVLLRANQLVTRELDLPTVLRRTAEAALELLAARSATVEVTARDGVPAGFAAAGSPPAGTADRLDVPVTVAGQRLGTLRVAGSARGRFTAEDRELAAALAATAGMAVQNARLYESARRRGEWLQASAAITRRLLSTGVDEEPSLEVVARGSRDVAEADLVAVVRPVDGPAGPTVGFRVEAGIGPAGPVPAGTVVPAQGTVLGRAFTTGEVVSLADGGPEPGLPWPGQPVGPVLVVPLAGSRSVLGLLCAARLPGRPPFGDPDVRMAASFANQAAVAVELAEARAEQARAVLLDERERIAADLHDSVVQRLFGVGLHLQGALAGLGPGRAADRVRAAVAEIDRIIDHVRTTVFQQPAEPDAPLTLRDQVLDTVAALTPVLGQEPDVRLSGRLRYDLPPALVEDLLAVLTQALTDAAGRAAGRVVVELDVGATEVRLQVHDGGQAPSGGVCPGLPGCQERAERHGGTFAVVPAAPTGRTLLWTAPAR